VVAALSIIISASVESARRFAPAVVAAALGISRALGRTGRPSEIAASDMIIPT
jgi:hypothetical protein